MKKLFYIGLIFISSLFNAEKNESIKNNYEGGSLLNRSGDVQSSPNLDRAKGYLLKGEVQTAILNYGSFMSWGSQPNGLWGQYTYIPDLSFVAGVPGHAYSSNWTTSSDDAWLKETIVNNIEVWVANEKIYSAWVNSDGTENFIAIVYNTKDDRGNIAVERSSLQEIDLVGGPQWVIDRAEEEIYLFLDDGNLNPNYASSRIGLAYPWSIRPAFKERTINADGYFLDRYDYGLDHEAWSSDDAYVYYGATFSESNLTRDNGYKLTDWQPSYDSRYNSHNLDHDAGEYFGNTPFTDSNDPGALLAHSTMPETWPTKYSFDSGSDEPFWPGWHADNYYGDSPELWQDVGIYNCEDGRSDPGCWKPSEDKFISDMDVYMEFDDRWAHLGNQVKENTYQQTGYPMGLKVRSMAHSYGVAYAEDILFVTVKVRNESGDFNAFEKDKDGNIIWLRDNNGNIITGSAMEMPDGTVINKGEGFDYQEVYLGFYMDADVLSNDINGSSYPHTNPDDFMRYIDCLVSQEFFPDGCEVINNDTLRISMAVIGDWDGLSPAGIEGFSMKTGEGGPDFGLVAIQLLDSPYASSPVDLNLDGEIDIYPNEKLKMTDWHWFDWYNRPGVISREGDLNCCAGDPGKAQAKNKEEIQYKIISGDITNLSDGSTSSSNEKLWFFHAPDPTDPTESDLNPHFDDVDALDESAAFLGDPEPGGGLDCVLEMSSGPFNLAVGEEVSFSFGVVFGQNYDDLLKNAKFGQIMYNSHYQGYTPPKTPNVMAKTFHNKIEIYWDAVSVYDSDVVTGYSDFEGFKIYKSIDGGITWGNVEGEIVIEGVSEGWKPYGQFDLDSLADATWCILGYDNNGNCNKHDNCSDPCIRGVEVSGPDTLASWFNLGNNTGFGSLLLDPENPDSVLIEVDSSTGDSIRYQYKFVDTAVSDGIEYTYSVVAYDTGVMAEVISYSDTTGQDFIVQEGLTKKIVSVPDPEGWGTINPYQSLESPKGSTIHESNFITVVPGYVPEATLDNIIVVPNPYIVNSHFNETEYKRRLRFTRLPQKCTITIYTVTGEKIREIVHSNVDDGSEWWDLRSYNNQEVAPGLYIYVVETDDAKKINKFAIIR